MVYSPKTLTPICSSCYKGWKLLEDVEGTTVVNGNFIFSSLSRLSKMRSLLQRNQLCHQKQNSFLRSVYSRVRLGWKSPEMFSLQFYYFLRKLLYFMQQYCLSFLQSWLLFDELHNLCFLPSNYLKIIIHHLRLAALIATQSTAARNVTKEDTCQALRKTSVLVELRSHAAISVLSWPNKTQFQIAWTT